MRGAWASRRWQVVAAITALSAFLHLWKLGQRPLAHDEAIDAFFSWQARSGGVMEYDPVYHGPLRFYLEGAVLRWIGTGPFEARLVAATAGIAATAVIASARSVLGRTGAPVAALVFTVSPTVLTVTRTGREDSLVVLCTVGLLLLVARALVAPRPTHLVAAGALLAATFALKETAFLLSLNALVFVAVLAVVAWVRPEGECRAAFARLRALGGQPWLWCAMSFALVFMVVYTSGFRYAAGLESGMFDGVRYWWGQHDVGRGGQPSFFYLAIYGAYEWLAVALALAGLAVTVRRRSLVGAWFAAIGFGNLALYSWAGEKFAWLAVHPLVALIALGGIGAQGVAEHVEGRSWARVPVAIGAALLALTGFVAVRPAITDGADPRELLVTVQTSVDVPPLAQRLRDAEADGRIDSIVIDSRGGGAWPWSWYLHGIDDVAYAGLDPAALPTEFDAIVLLAYEEPPEAPPGYRVERFRLREWWVPDYGGASLGDLGRWFFTRQVWSPTASADQYLLIREDG